MEEWLEKGQSVLLTGEDAEKWKKSCWVDIKKLKPEPEKLVELSIKRITKEGIYYFTTEGFYENGNIWSNNSSFSWDFYTNQIKEWNENKTDYKIPESWWKYHNYDCNNKKKKRKATFINDVVIAWRELSKPYRE